MTVQSLIELIWLVSSGCDLTLFGQIVNKGPKIKIASFNVKSIWATDTHVRSLNFSHKLQQCI